eukprot:scaffold13482_cov46-Attheya_sp.AAC.1
MCLNTEKVDDAFLMGNRIVSFLSHGLPTHPNYNSTRSSMVRLRKMSQITLEEVSQQVQSLAKHIDERELDNYIFNDLDVPGSDGQDELKPPPPTHQLLVPSSFASDEISDLTMPQHDGSARKQESKKSFTKKFLFSMIGSDSLPSVATVSTDSGTLSTSLEETCDSRWEAFSGWPPSHKKTRTSTILEYSSSDDSSECPNLNLEFECYSDVVDDDTPLPTVKAGTLDDISFETDSEAYDSWEQDPSASLGNAFNCTKLGNDSRCLDIAATPSDEFIASSGGSCWNTCGSSQMFPDESQTFDDLDIVDSTENEPIQAETYNVLGIRSKAMDRNDEIANVEQRGPDINNLIKQRWVSFDLTQNHEKLNEEKKGRIVKSLAKGTKSVSFSLKAQVVGGCGNIYNCEVSEDGGLGPRLLDFDPRRPNKELKLAYI